MQYGDGIGVQFSLVNPMHQQKAGMMVTSPLLDTIKAILQSHPHNAYKWPSNSLSQSRA